MGSKGRCGVRDLLRRHAALDATLAKFRGKAIDWQAVDCVRMLRFHLVQLGYSPPPLPVYRNAKGARRALDRAGGMEKVLDALLERIPHASLLPGDVALLAGDGMDAVMLCAGHKLIGWHEDAGAMTAVTALEVKGAWRV